MSPVKGFGSLSASIGDSLEHEWLLQERNLLSFQLTTCSCVIKILCSFWSSEYERINLYFII